MTWDSKKKFCDGWHTGVQRVKNCEVEASKDKKLIVLTWQVNEKVRAMSEEMVDLEWLGYLQGKESEEGYYITDISVPKQEVTAGSVDVLEPIDALGTVHLHPGKGTPGHSGTDDKYIAGNHTVMVVTNLLGDYEGHVKVDLPCGASYLAKADVMVERVLPADLDEFFIKGVANILELKPIVKEPINTVVQTCQGNTPRTLICAKCQKPVGQEHEAWVKGVLYHSYCQPTTISRYCYNCKTYVTAGYSEGSWNKGSWLCPDCEKKLKAQTGFIPQNGV